MSVSELAPDHSDTDDTSVPGLLNRYTRLDEIHKELGILFKPAEMTPEAIASVVTVAHPGFDPARDQTVQAREAYSKWLQGGHALHFTASHSLRLLATTEEKRRFMTDHLQQMYVARKPPEKELQVIIDHSLLIDEGMSEFLGETTALAQSIEKKIDDPHEGFQVVTDISGINEPLEGDKQIVISAAESLMATLLLGKPELAETYLSRLLGGTYDAGVVNHLLTQDPTNNAALLLANIRDYSARLLPDASLEDLASKMVDGKLYWPEEAQRAFNGYKNHLARAMQARLEDARARLLDFGMLLPDGVDGALALDQSIRKHMDNFAAFKAVTTEQPNIHTVERPGTKRSAGRPRSRRQRVGRPVLQQAVAPELEVQRKGYELVTLDRNTGQFYAKDDGQFDRIKEKYLSIDPSEALRTDLDNVIRYIEKELNFGGAMVPYLEKFPYYELPTEDGKKAIFEFKPREVPGLSLKSEQGNKMRILVLMLTDKKLALLAIYNRKDVHDTLHKFGFKTSAKQ